MSICEIAVRNFDPDEANVRNATFGEIANTLQIVGMELFSSAIVHSFRNTGIHWLLLVLERSDDRIQLVPYLMADLVAPLFGKGLHDLVANGDMQRGDRAKSLCCSTASCMQIAIAGLLHNGGQNIRCRLYC